MNTTKHKKIHSNFKHFLSQQLIEKFVKPERLKEKTAWGREIKILKKLLNQYPNTEFWCKLDLGYDLNSLAFFLSKRGQDILKVKWGNFLLENPAEEEYNFDTKSENIVTEKPKTLSQFLQ